MYVTSWKHDLCYSYVKNTDLLVANLFNNCSKGLFLKIIKKCVNYYRPASKPLNLISNAPKKNCKGLIRPKPF